MKKGKRFIGFDLGAESGRCIVATLKDQKISLDEVHRFTTHNVEYDKGFHWDILAINKEIVEGLTKAKKMFGSELDGIGVDTWGVDYVLLDKEDRIIGYPYHYRDNRTDNIMEEAFDIVPKETIYNKVGIQFVQFNTVFQLLAESKRITNFLNITETVLLMPDYLNFFLSGEKKAEFSIASTTGLADPKTRNWCWELIDKFNLPRNIFPEIVEPGTKLGTLNPALASKTGLDPNIPVIASAGHDTASAVVSVPADGSDWAFLSSGTWSLMGVEIKESLLNADAMKYNFTNEGGIEGTTRFLKNIIGLWPIQECRRYWLQKGKEYGYPELAGLAKAEGFVNAWVDLDDPRFLKAGEMPEKIISYLQETGQTVKDNVGFIIGVVLESLAFSYRNTIKEIESVTNKKIEKLHAVGGGIQNGLLSQYTADAIGRTVIAGPVEGTIIGNIGVQVMASGEIKDLKTWRNIVQNSFDLKKYEPIDPGYFNENEESYKSILKKK
ncbi:MAG: rhamnulokinase family protein [Ignavibacteria bacterium]|jgi:sugar (pentulose or hexulose) kinase